MIRVLAPSPAAQKDSLWLFPYPQAISAPRRTARRNEDSEGRERVRD